MKSFLWLVLPLLVLAIHGQTVTGDLGFSTEISVGTYHWQITEWSAGSGLSQQGLTYSVKVLQDPSSLRFNFTGYSSLFSNVSGMETMLSQYFSVSFNDFPTSSTSVVNFIYPNQIHHDNGTQTNLFDYLHSVNGSLYSLSDGQFKLNTSGLVSGNAELIYDYSSGLLLKQSVTSPSLTFSLELVNSLNSSSSTTEDSPLMLSLVPLLLIPLQRSNKLIPSCMTSRTTKSGDFN